MNAEPASSPWERAGLAAALFAVDPRLGGVALRAGAGEPRDVWLRLFIGMLPDGAPVRRVPIGISQEALLGGLDLAASLSAGRPIATPGLLARAQDGVVIMAMAERVSAATVARVVAPLDSGSLAFGVVALDESEGEEEGLAAALSDRLAFHLDIRAVGHREIRHSAYGPDLLQDARRRLSVVEAPQSAIDALVKLAARFGIVSFRAPLLALRTARAACALRGAERVEEEDLVIGARLVLAPRAVAFASAAPEEPPPSQPEGGSISEESVENAGDSEAAPDAFTDILVAATLAAIPPALLERISSGVAREGVERGGKSEIKGVSTRRGRPLGVRPGHLAEGRLALIDTLRAAAPWQRLRAGDDESQRFLVRREDFRLFRFRKRKTTTAIFVVDASGSAALQRLAEVKGAIELLLADCYVRRDCVAMISFRGKGAEIVLPPTRSLARAKRTLAGLAGGGGTPLASGIDRALELADSVRRKGQSPLLVVMTDGRANIGRDGEAGRARAFEDALNAGERVKAAGVPALAIDTAPPSAARGETPTFRLGEAMNARYVPLPNADATRVSDAVRAAVLA